MRMADAFCARRTAVYASTDAPAPSTARRMIRIISASARQFATSGGAELGATASPGPTGQRYANRSSALLCNTKLLIAAAHLAGILRLVCDTGKSMLPVLDLPECSFGFPRRILRLCGESSFSATGLTVRQPKKSQWAQRISMRGVQSSHTSCCVLLLPQKPLRRSPPLKPWSALLHEGGAALAIVLAVETPAVAWRSLPYRGRRDPQHLVDRRLDAATESGALSAMVRATSSTARSAPRRPRPVDQPDALRLAASIRRRCRGSSARAPARPVAPACFSRVEAIDDAEPRRRNAELASPRRCADRPASRSRARRRGRSRGCGQ